MAHSPEGAPTLLAGSPLWRCYRASISGKAFWPCPGGRWKSPCPLPARSGRPGGPGQWSWWSCSISVWGPRPAQYIQSFNRVEALDRTCEGHDASDDVMCLFHHDLQAHGTHSRMLQFVVLSVMLQRCGTRLHSRSARKIALLPRAVEREPNTPVMTAFRRHLARVQKSACASSGCCVAQGASFVAAYSALQLDSLL